MLNRRNFLINSGIVTAGALLSADAIAKGYNKKNIGLQLYSLRAEVPAGLDKVFAKISAAGYSSVEMYGYSAADRFFKNSAKELVDLLKKHHLSSPSGHYQLDIFVKDGQQTVDDAAAAGHKYVTIAYLPEPIRKSIDDYKKIAERLNEAAALCKKNNLKLAYHNHDFEFMDMEGTNGYETLLSQTDKSLVNFELDLYWVKRAGKDPLALFASQPGRFKMWHVKDMDKKDPKLQTEVGSGSIDFKPIFAKAKLSGLEYFFVEQENFAIPSEESITKSAAFLKNSIL